MARFAIEDLVGAVVRMGASDLHLKPDSPPILRVNGELGLLEGYDKLSAEDVVGVLYQMLHDPVRLERLHRTGAVDFAYESDQGVRLRINAFQERGRFSVACRPIPDFIKSFGDLNLPPVLAQVADEERGLILVTGTTGSGKSTTLAAMLDWINERKSKHIVTIEDPIEFVHRNKRSAMAQREVGRDTPSFHEALRYVLRQDPDVVLIGEMRDEETVHTALSAAETGHLVLSTVHSVDAAETVNRIIDVFPPHMHAQVRSMIAGTLKGVVSQRLVRAKDGGRVATCEIMRMTGRVRDFILDPSQTGKLGEVIADGGFYGMQTFDQALFTHVKAGRLGIEEAVRAATSPHDFKLLLASDGRRGTTMEDVADLRAA